MLGWQEVVLIFIILFLVFGPSKLPKIARELGKAMRELNNATSAVTEGIRSSSTIGSRSSMRVTDKQKSDKTPSDTAKKLNNTNEGKIKEKMDQENLVKIESEKEKASNKNVAKR